MEKTSLKWRDRMKSLGKAFYVHIPPKTSEQSKKFNNYYPDLEGTAQSRKKEIMQSRTHRLPIDARYQIWSKGNNENSREKSRRLGKASRLNGVAGRAGGRDG